MYQRTARLYNWVIEPFLAPIKRKVAALCLERGYRKVLDLCCGTGTQCALLAARGFEAVGVDGSPEMLSVARRESPASVEYRLGKASGIEFPEGRFDAVIISHALHENPREERTLMLQQALRAVRPGGGILLIDYIAAEGLSARLAHLFVRAIEAAAGRDNYRNFSEFMREGGLRGVLRKSGLREIGFYSFHAGATGLAVALRDAPPGRPEP